MFQANEINKRRKRIKTKAYNNVNTHRKDNGKADDNMRKYRRRAKFIHSKVIYTDYIGVCCLFCIV